MGLDRRDDPDLGSNRGVTRLLPERAGSLPAISRAPLTGKDSGGRGTEMDPLTAQLDDLRERVRMTWNDQARGWVGAPSEIVRAFEDDGCCECKHLIATRRHDGRPAGGVWQGGNPRTGSTASAM
jgi:hypothetical protein